MADVVSFGSINVDRVGRLESSTLEELEAEYPWFPEPGETVVVEDVPERVAGLADRTFLGGKGANQAVAAAGAGASAAMLGMVGPDEDEFSVLASLDRRGVDVGGVGVAAVETGKAYVFVDPTGENWIAIIPGANGAVDEGYAEANLETIRDAACLLLQNEIPTAAMRRALDAVGQLPEADRPTVIFDPAPAPGSEDVIEHPAIDVITPNEQEYAALEGRLDGFDGTLIRTRGQGYILVENGKRFTVSPPAVDAVDTTGAGDIFNGFLAARLVSGDTLFESVELAAAAAALSTTYEGVQRATPTLAAARQLLMGEA